MPKSMYDKLGDLLSEAIDSGNFFASDSTENKKSVQKSIHVNNKNEDCIDKFTPKSSNPVTIQVKSAFTIVGVNQFYTYEQSREIYHTKLKRFHPDLNADNEIMNKITKEKTDELIKAWKIIEDWYKS